MLKSLRAGQAGPVLLPAYLVCVLVSGALLAPLLFSSGSWLVEIVRQRGLESTPVLGWLVGKIANADFARFFNRAFLVAALLWLIPFARWAGVRRQDLGLEPNAKKWVDATVGFFLAAGLLLAMGWVFMHYGRFAVNPKNSFASLIGPSLVAAISVALLEEFFFRGALFAFLLRSLSPTKAMLFLAAFFSIVHLLQPPPDLVISQPNWASGFTMVGHILGRFGDASFLVAEFCTLFVVGWILGLARFHTRSLWLAIGLHAGWVLGVKLFGGLTRTAKKIKIADFSPWIGKDLKSGVAPLAVLAFTGLLIWFYLSWRRKR